MESTCPHCGEKKRVGTATECPACGRSLRGGVGKVAGRGRAYDGYAVGRRVLSIAPAWLFLIVVGFLLALLFFSWVSRRGGAGEPGGEAFKNEAMNQSPSPAEGGRAGKSGAKLSRAKAGAASAAVDGPAPPVEKPDPASEDAAAVAGEADSYSVQVGAFAALSQANEQVSRLRAAGFEARVVETASATRFRYQVRCGLYATREEAARLASDLRAGGAAGETVIIEPERK